MVINSENKGLGIVAGKHIKQQEIILKFSGELVPQGKVKNHNAALQLGENLFLESHGAVDERLNHSCSPNCYINFTQLTLIALKAIKTGEELTFDYNTSEYDLIDQGCSFTCLCGSQDCIGNIKGFKYLPISRKKKIELFLSPFLKEKWKQELKS